MRQRFQIVFLLLMTWTAASSCSLSASIKTKEPEPNIYYPLSGFNGLTNPDNFKQFSVHFFGDGTSSTEIYWAFGFNNTNGDNWGNFAFSPNNSFSIQRGTVPGPCGGSGGTAPNCPFTWGSGNAGLYHGRNVNTFPAFSNNSHTWSKLKYIKADVRMDLVTGSLNGGFAACGLNLGLGNAGASHVDTSYLPTSLNIANRGSRGDMILFSYHIVSGSSSTDMFRIETPLNQISDPSFNKDARWDSSFDMVEASPLTAYGDYIKYEMLLEFNHTSDTISVTLTPLETNKNISFMKKQNLTWDVFASHNYNVGGDGRAGIAVDHGGTGYPLSKDQVKNSKVTVGFHMNGVTKLCQLSNLVIGSFD